MITGEPSALSPAVEGEGGAIESPLRAPGAIDGLPRGVPAFSRRSQLSIALHRSELVVAPLMSAPE